MLGSWLRKCDVRHFAIFFANGVAVGIFCWALQIAFYRVLPGRNNWSYLGASVLAYAIAVAVNFFIQAGLIFAQAGSFLRFTSVSVVMTGLVSGLAVLMKALLQQAVPDDVAANLGFAASAVLTSPLSYFLVSTYVFAKPSTAVHR
jgi:putative flippase GtrA